MVESEEGGGGGVKTLEVEKHFQAFRFYSFCKMSGVCVCVCVCVCGGGGGGGNEEAIGTKRNDLKFDS